MITSLHDEIDKREEIAERARDVAESERQVLVDAIARGDDPLVAMQAFAAAVAHELGPVLRDGYLLGVEFGAARARR